MRLIPGKTKVKIELFRGVTLGDVIVAMIGLTLLTLVLLSTFPGRLYIIIGIIAICGLLLFRLDSQPNYILLLGVLRYLSYPRGYRRAVKDAALKKKETQEEPDSESKEHIRAAIEQIMYEKERKKTEDENAGKNEEAKSETSKKEKKFSPMQNIIPFTGISEGFIEYNGSYYGTVIEITPIEFRFFSQYRRDASIENCFGKIIRGLRMEYAANIIKIERPIVYTGYLEKEYEKLSDLRNSYEKGLLSEEELQSRIEIQYDRINGIEHLCTDEKVIQPFYYVALFNSSKRQLQIETENALIALQQGELPVRRLVSDKELAIFLKYTNHLDFDENEIENLAPEEYVKWAMPETLSFTMRTAVVDRIVTHQMRVVNYPSVVGDAWLAGVMSIPATKVVIKATPMDRTKAIRAIDRSLQELRGQVNATSIDSKIIELETHIETLSRLLVTLQQENETLLTVNIYISMYDTTRTAQLDGDAVKNSSLPVIADMKKVVRRSWQETGMRLNGMDFAQHECFIGSQVSAYDPFYKDGRGIPSNTVAAMYPWIYARVSDEGGIRLGTNDGVPVFIDFFRRDSERVNSNMVIIGKSGSGKSYGTKSLLTNMASEDSKIFILDPENEYTELAHNLHGKVINVGNASSGRLNPFHIITALDDDESESDASGNSYATHLQFLEEFFRQILPDVDKDALEYLNSLVERLYTNFNITEDTNLSKLRPEDYPIFDDLYDLVLEDFQRTNNPYLRTMLQTLMNYVSKFATGGRNATIWNGPSSITTDENFSVFNFQSLLANRNSTIANAQMLLVLKYVDNEIIKNRDYNTKYGLKRKVIVVIDEAHVFIDTKFPVALDFMFQLAKRIRKYNGMQIVITQNIKDFVGSEEIARKSTAIINACQYSFIFGLAPNDMDDLCKLYEKAGGINEIEQDQIVTAPRGRAFTVMSPTSRSSFMIEVSQPMVDMFEQQHYRSHYFDDEEGKAYWEEMIRDSRAEHEANLNERLSEQEYEEEADSDDIGINFTEIDAEEADRLYYSEEEEPQSSSVRFEETVEPQREIPPITQIPVPPYAQQVYAQPVQPQLDIASLISTIREEVKREVEMQQLQATVQDLQAQVARNSAVQPDEEDIFIPRRSESPRQPVQEESYYKEEAYEPEPDEDEYEDENLYETEESYESDEGVAAEEPEEEAYESDDRYEYEEDEDYDDSNLYDSEEDEEDEEDEDYDSDDETESGDDDDFSPKFDIMALLDEQLDNYSDMNLMERMDEIEVDTMEVSLEELAAFVKENRKRRYS
ncbi:MAG: DUF87 domain-containing protein [Oscillospiraceae bacterium]|nr:DUF87 domain-containing protein [Oscillospiraceae bacterium]